MAEISRYVLVDKQDQEGEYEYDSYQDALAACDSDHAIIERTYEYSDSTLVYTPNGRDTWPPKQGSRRK